MTHLGESVGILFGCVNNDNECKNISMLFDIGGGGGGRICNSSKQNIAALNKNALKTRNIQDKIVQILQIRDLF